jgi:hypothetical protein
MTDGLTDAVRRLKGLQEDIERLKSGQDEEGEPRLLFSAQEQAVAIDSIRTGPDEARGETATASDRQAGLRLQRRIEDQGAWNSVGWSTSTYGDGEDERDDTRRRRRSI